MLRYMLQISDVTRFDICDVASFSDWWTYPALDGYTNRVSY